MLATHLKIKITIQDVILLYLLDSWGSHYLYLAFSVQLGNIPARRIRSTSRSRLNTPLILMVHGARYPELLEKMTGL